MGPLQDARVVGRVDYERSLKDPEMQVQGKGRRFASESKARAYAESLAGDAVLVRDGANIWVYKAHRTLPGEQFQAVPPSPSATARLQPMAGIDSKVAGVALAKQDGTKDWLGPESSKSTPTPEERRTWALSDYPDYAQKVAEVLTRTQKAITKALAHQRGEKTKLLSALAKDIKKAQKALGNDDFPSAVAALSRIEKAAQSARVPVDIRTSLLTALKAPAAPTPAPAENVQQAEQLLRTLSQQSEILANAVFADPYADFIWGRGTLRPDDTMAHLLVLNASLWSVLRDIRYGKIGPKDFGKANWNAVQAEDYWHLAMQRLPTLDQESTIRGLIRDPFWQESPIKLRDPQRGSLLQLVKSDPHARIFELRPENVAGPHQGILGLFKRSFASTGLWPFDQYMAEPSAVQAFAQSDLGRHLHQSAVQTGTTSPHTYPTAQAEAAISLAHTLFKGSSLPENASQALLVMSTATGVSTVETVPLFDVDESELKRRVKDEELVSYISIGGEQGPFIGVQARKPEEVIADIKDKLRAQSKRAGHQASPESTPQFSKQTLQQMHAMLDGDLPARLASEASRATWYRRTSEVGQMVAILLATWGSGVVYDAAALELGAGRMALQYGNLAATSATFTSMSFLQAGDVDLWGYPNNAAIFWLLGWYGRFAQGAGKAVAETAETTPAGKWLAATSEKVLGNKAALSQQVGNAGAHAGIILGSSAVLTGYTAVESTLRHSSPTWKQTKTQFWHNMQMLTALHVISRAIFAVRPMLAPGSQNQAKLDALSKKQDTLQRELTTKLQELSNAWEQTTKFPEGLVEQLNHAKKVEAMMQEIAGKASEVEASRVVLVEHLRRTLPPEDSQPLIDQLEKVKTPTQQAAPLLDSIARDTQLRDLMTRATVDIQKFFGYFVTTLPSYGMSWQSYADSVRALENHQTQLTQQKDALVSNNSQAKSQRTDNAIKALDALNERIAHGLTLARETEATRPAIKRIREIVSMTNIPPAERAEAENLIKQISAFVTKTHESRREFLRPELWEDVKDSWLDDLLSLRGFLDRDALLPSTLAMIKDAPPALMRGIQGELRVEEAKFDSEFINAFKPSEFKKMPKWTMEETGRKFTEEFDTLVNRYQQGTPAERDALMAEMADRFGSVLFTRTLQELRTGDPITLESWALSMELPTHQRQSARDFSENQFDMFQERLKNGADPAEFEQDLARELNNGGFYLIAKRAIEKGDLSLFTNSFQQMRPPLRAVQRIKEIFEDPEYMLRMTRLMEREVMIRADSSGKPRDTAFFEMLNEWESGGGFGPVANIEKRIYSFNEWHQMLQQGALFHDVALNDANRQYTSFPHGQETHRVQWNIIMRDMRLHPEFYADQQIARPVDLFIAIAKTSNNYLDWNGTGYRPFGKQAQFTSYWDALFDTDSTYKNFSSPEFVRPTHHLWPSVGSWY